MTQKAENNLTGWQKDLLEHPEKYRVGNSDPINAYDCFSCGGRCCTNTQVSISPYDIYRIVQTPEVAEPLGIFTSHDLFAPRKEGEEPLLAYYLGPGSRLPQVAINMVEVGEEFTICPFNAPVVVQRDKKDAEKLKPSDLTFLKAKYGNLARLCVLERAKPTICRAFPLGRMIKLEKDASGQPRPKTQYVKMDTEWCDQFAIPGGRMKVRDYIKKWSLDEGYANSDAVFAWHKAMSDRVKDEQGRYVAGLLLYDFDLPALEAAEKFGWKGEEKMALVKKLRPPSFENLMRRGYRAIEMAERQERSKEPGPR